MPPYVFSGYFMPFVQNKIWNKLFEKLETSILDRFLTWTRGIKDGAPLVPLISAPRDGHFCPSSSYPCPGISRIPCPGISRIFCPSSSCPRTKNFMDRSSSSGSRPVTNYQWFLESASIKAQGRTGTRAVVGRPVPSLRPLPLIIKHNNLPCIIKQLKLKK